MNVIINQEKEQQQQNNPKYSQQNLIPQGTCSLEMYKKLSQYNIILSFPLSQSLTFPNHPKYFPCIIVKENVEGQQPIYHIFYQILKKRLLSAQKQPNNIGCNYILSKKQKPKKDQYYVGKLRGNFRNNQFMIFDGGQNPKKKCVRKRKQFGYIKYNQDSIFNKQQNKIDIFIPEIQQRPQSSYSYPKYHPKQYIPKEQKQNILLQEYKKKSSQVIKLRQKQIQQKQSNKQEQKSFQKMKYFFSNSLLQQQNKIEVSIGVQKQNKKQYNQDQISFKFCSRTKNTYCLQIGYPFNLIQGFCIALSLIEKKNCN